MASLLLVRGRMPAGSREVIVIGAGAAGLAAAETLSRAGVAVLVLEARSRAGGRVATRRVRGWPLPVELGAEFIHGRSEEIFRIAGRAGLLVGRITDVHASVTGSRWTVTRDFWKTFDRITRGMRGSGRDRSVAGFLESRRRMPRPDKRLLTSIVEGYHAAPLELASEHALSTAGDPPRSPEDREQFRIVSGYDGVTKWLASRIDPRRCRFLFSTAVREIRWRPGSVRVRTERSGEFRARHAIVTVPVGVLNAPAQRPAGIRFDPEPRDQRRALEKIGMGQVVKVVLRLRPHFGEIWRERFPARESGAGEIAFLHRRAAPWPTWWSAAPAQVPMMTAWAGGPAAQALTRLSRREILEEALQTIASLLDAAPDRVRPLLIAWHMHDWNRDPYSRGAYSYQIVGGASAPAALARPVRDTLFFAGEATEPEQNGTVAGAIASGRRAAGRILKQGSGPSPDGT